MAPYIVAQVVGGIVGAYLLLHIAQGHSHFNVHAVGFACNGFGEHSPEKYSQTSCIIMEATMTLVLLLAVLSTTRKKFPSEIAGIFLGFTLAVIHLVSIPVTNTSVNMARSIGVALLHGGWAVQQLWLFAVAQLIGVILAIFIFQALEEK